jgi:hypothetical protein
VHTKFWSENLKGRNHLEDIGIEGRTVVVKGISWEDMGWIH